MVERQRRRHETPGTFAFAAAQLTKMVQARKNMHGRVAQARDIAKKFD
jgi:hypothetical protein